MTRVTRLLVDSLETEIGVLTLVSTPDGVLCSVEFESRAERRERALARHHGPALALEPARDPGGNTTALRRYFDGELDALLPLRVAAVGTPFQRAVWGALREIPAGSTLGYGELARRIGRPRAVRAVGLANGANPVGVVVPCHRVIGADGSLTGYGGGLERKRFLLEHEARSLSRTRRVVPSRAGGTRVLSR